MALTPDDLKDIDARIANQLEAEQIVQIFHSMDERDKEKIALDISRFMYDRQQALRSPDNPYTPRFMVEGQDINSATVTEPGIGAQVGHQGPTLPRIVNFTGGAQGTLDPRNGEQLNLKIQAGGTDCMFDAIVSTCWATEMTAGRGTQGQLFKSLTGCDFRVYSLLSSAIAGMIALGGHRKVLMCNSETLTASISLNGIDAIRIFGLSSNPPGISSGGADDASPVVIKAASGTEFFTKTAAGASKNGNGIGFQGLSFEQTGAGCNVLEISNGSNWEWMEFEDCYFDIPDANIVDGATNLGFTLKVSNCAGNLGRFWFTSASFNGLDNFFAFNNILVMLQFWAGSSPGTSSQSGRPDRAWFEGGRYSVTAETSLVNCDNILQFREMTIETTALVFSTAAEAQSCRDFVFQNLTIIATGASAKFANFGSHAGNFCQGLFIDGVFGYESSGVNATGNFLEVEDTWQNVFIGTLNQYGWTATYSGPTPTPSPSQIHTLLDANQHSDTLLDAATRGDIVIANSTPKWTALPIGTTETVINSDGSDPSWTSSPKIGTKLTLANLGLTTDDQFYLDALSTVVPRLNWDFDDYIAYNRSSNSHEWNTAGSTKMRLASSPTVLQLLGAAHFGASLSTPTNTIAGDLTAVRLIVPNATLADTDVISNLGGPVGITALGHLRLYDATDTDYVGLRAPTVPHATKFVYALPADAPANGEVLTILSTAGSPIITTEWTAGGSGTHDANLIQDDDNDTYVNTEVTADDDIIESATFGTIRSRLSALGLQLANSTDFNMYSGAFASKVVDWDGATGHLSISNSGSATADAGSLATYGATFTDPSTPVTALNFNTFVTLTAGNAQDITGIDGSAQITGAFTASGITASNIASVNAVLATISDARNFWAQSIIDTDDPGVITNRYGLYVSDITGGGSAGTQYGVYLENLNFATTNRAIYSLGGISNHVGAFRIGSSTVPTNVTDGDLTATRLIIPDGAIVHSAKAQILGPLVMKDLSAVLFSDDDDSNYVGLRAPTTAQSENYIYELPDDDPTNGQVLAVKATAASPIITTEWITPASDSDDVTYTPADNNDWGGSDPGDVEQALDVLADRGSKGREVIYAARFRGNIFRTSPTDPPEYHDTGSEDNIEAGIPFPNSGTSYAACELWLPINYKDASTFAVRFLWTALTGSGDVEWGVRAVAVSNANSLNAAMGSTAFISPADTLSATNEIQISVATTMTAAGSPVGDDWLLIEVIRNAADADDTLSATAYLKAIEIIWNTDAGGYA